LDEFLRRCRSEDKCLLGRQPRIQADEDSRPNTTRDAEKDSLARRPIVVGKNGSAGLRYPYSTQRREVKNKIRSE
jgi:hypothetical protein